MTIIFHGMLRSHNFGDVLLAHIGLGWIRDVTNAPIKAAFVTPELRERFDLQPARMTDILSSACLVLSGGGYFQLRNNRLPRFGTFAKNAGPVLLAQAAGRPTAMIGIGVGPCPDGPLKFVLRRLFGMAELICVRDRASADAVRMLGREPVETADMVFALTPASLPDQAIAYADGIVGRGHHGRAVGLQLSDTPDGSGAYARLYQQLASRIAAAPDTHFFLLEDHPAKGSRQQAFQAYVQQIAGLGRTTVVSYAGPFELAALLSRFDAVLTDKLHVGLVAAAMGTPPFSIAKHRKNVGSYEAIRARDNLVLLESASGEEIGALIDRFLATSQRFEVDSTVRAAALENRSLLHRFLSSHVLAGSPGLQCGHTPLP